MRVRVHRSNAANSTGATPPTGTSNPPIDGACRKHAGRQLGARVCTVPDRRRRRGGGSQLPTGHQKCGSWHCLPESTLLPLTAYTVDTPAHTNPHLRPAEVARGRCVSTSDASVPTEDRSSSSPRAAPRRVLRRRSAVVVTSSSCVPDASTTVLQPGSSARVKATIPFTRKGCHESVVFNDTTQCKRLANAGSGCQTNRRMAGKAANLVGNG